MYLNESDWTALLTLISVQLCVVLHCHYYSICFNKHHNQTGGEAHPFFSMRGKELFKTNSPTLESNNSTKLTYILHTIYLQFTKMEYQLRLVYWIRLLTQLKLIKVHYCFSFEVTYLHHQRHHPVMQWKSHVSV